jgi:hypothetical protein
MTEAILRQRIRRWLRLFIFLLVVSGLLVFPLETMLKALANCCIPPDTIIGHWWWKVLSGVQYNNIHFGFLSYGYDWLAYFHLVIALALLGPLRDPVRNIWVLEFLMIAALGILPVSLIGGAVRGLPMWWRIFEIIFIIIAFLPLWRVWTFVKRLEIEYDNLNNQ